MGQSHLTCTRCNALTAWHGGPPGRCRACHEPLIPIAYELGARFAILCMVLAFGLLTRDWPPDTPPMRVLLATTLAAVVVELGEWVAIRRWRLRSPDATGLPFLLLLILLGFMAPVPAGVKVTFFGVYVLLKMASPLAMMPLRREPG